MKMEIRADNSLKIEGYVNAVMRESRPVMTPQGKVNEIVEERAFEKALERTDNVPMTVDHNPNKQIANTKDGTLKLYEDNIGLRAEAIISDAETVENARQGKIKGWSFGMRNVSAELEERANKLPLRRIKSLDLDHVTLVVNKIPCYSATSLELRADEEINVEERAFETKVEVSEAKKTIDYSKFENRLKEI
jgi:HK97 family phage prohead protease